MSKWIEQLNESNCKRINDRIEKLKIEYEQLRREHADRPYTYYEKAMERREAEIEELELIADPKHLKRELDDWKDEVEHLRKVLGRVGILAANIDPSDRKSDANLRRLIAMTDKYSCYDPQFVAEAEAGIW